ncbi:MAG: arylsulfatase [Anaerohalosphaeraceae bacterium]
MGISRRMFLQTAGLLGIGSLLPSCSAWESNGHRRQSKPNVIYILADDLGYGDLSCYGQKRFATPNLDRLAQEGMRFTQHYAGSTVCAPSRCCLMTGLHTGHAQIRGNKGVEPEGQYPLAEGTYTLPRMFKDAGYATGAFGKWGLGGTGNSGDPSRQGFDLFFGYKCQSLAHFYYPKYLWRNEDKVELPDNDPKTQQGLYSSDLIMDEALQFVRANKDKPFFMYLTGTIPHAELAVPEKNLAEFRGKYPEKPFAGNHYGAQPTPRAAFAAMVSKLDGDVGRVMDMLRELGLDNNTLVMFSSDNGPHKEGGADPDFFDSNGPLKGYKRDVYEGGIRVPMIARWPGMIAAGTVTDHISAFWDVLPTCAELAGGNSPACDGLSFLPTLLGRDKDQKQHEYLYWEFHEQGGKQAIRMGQWKAVRLNVMKNPDAAIELYDLSSDIGEQKNVAADHPDITTKMKAICLAAHQPNKQFPFFNNE